MNLRTYGAPAPRSERNRLPGFLLLAVAFAAAGMASADAARAAGQPDRGGAVYVMTNASSGNEILVFRRDRSGRLTPMHEPVSTGGTGGSTNAAIDPLGSQGALVHDDATGLLFAVNALDNSVAALDAAHPSLRPRLIAVVPSGGSIPVSVAVSEHRLYVLNAGGSGSVATFAIGSDGLALLGTLDLGLPMAASSIPFDQVAAPGQVGVDELARHLLITHLGTQSVLTLALDDDGLPEGPITSTVTPGIGPFAFDVTRYGTTLVAEAASGAVTAFDPPVGGAPLTIATASVATGQAATCWIVVHDAGYAYVSNTGSNTLSAYRWTRTGKLELLDDVAAVAGGAPIDLALANRGGFLYSLDAATGTVSGFAVSAESGALTPVHTLYGLPAAAGLQGIAARDF